MTLTKEIITQRWNEEHLTELRPLLKELKPGVFSKALHIFLVIPGLCFLFFAFNIFRANPEHSFLENGMVSILLMLVAFGFIYPAIRFFLDVRSLHHFIDHLSDYRITKAVVQSKTIGVSKFNQEKTQRLKYQYSHGRAKSLPIFWAELLSISKGREVTIAYHKDQKERSFLISIF